MSLLSRISNLFKSNINAAIDAMSDPAKEIDLLVTEMEEEVKKGRIELRDTLAREKLAQKRVDECYRGVQKWQEHAERAVTAGDDELAREALRRRDDAERQLEEAERQLAQQSQAVAAMTAGLRRNEAKVGEIKLRKETLKAKAKASKQALENHSGGAGADAFARFDALMEDLDFKESQVQAMEEINAERTLSPARDAELEEKFNRLLPASAAARAGAVPGKSPKDQEMDDRLAALKAKLDKKDPGAVT